MKTHLEISIKKTNFLSIFWKYHKWCKAWQWSGTRLMQFNSLFLSSVFYSITLAHCSFSVVWHSLEYKAHCHHGISLEKDSPLNPCLASHFSPTETAQSHQWRGKAQERWPWSTCGSHTWLLARQRWCCWQVLNAGQSAHQESAAVDLHKGALLWGSQELHHQGTPVAGNNLKIKENVPVSKKCT